jgi:hypothetical protein
MFNVSVKLGTGLVTYACYDSAEWVQVGYNATESARYVYEEAMWWNMDDTPQLSKLSVKTNRFIIRGIRFSLRMGI